MCEFAEEDEGKDREASKSPTSGTRRRASHWRISLFVVVCFMAVLASTPMREFPSESAADATSQDEITALQEAARRTLATGRTSAPSLHSHVASDFIVALVVAAVFMVGLLTGSCDLQEMQEEESQKEVNTKKHQENFKGKPQDPAAMLPAALQLALNMATFSAAAMCAWAMRRRWLQVSTTATSAASHLPRFTPVASDDITVLLCAVFVLLGLAAMRTDFQIFYTEEAEKTSKKAS